MAAYPGMALRFDFIQGPGTPKLTIQDISSGIPFAYTGYFVVTDPLSSVIHAGSFVSPDTDSGTFDFLLDVNLTLDSGGSPVCGEYYVTYYLRNTGTGDVYDISKSYTYCVKTFTPVIEYDVECFLNYIKSKDETDYSYTKAVSQIGLTRTHTLTAPAGSGVGPFSGSTAEITGSPLYTQVWQTTLTVQINFDMGDQVYEQYYMTGYDSTEVVCDTYLCKLACQISTLYNNYLYALKCNTALANMLRSKLSEISILYSLYLSKTQCGENTDTVYQQIQDILGTEYSNCCGCDDAGPRLVLAPGAGGGTVVVQSGDSFINVSSSVVGSTTTYTVTFNDSAITNLIADYVEFNANIQWDGLNNETSTISGITTQGTLLVAPSFGFEFLSGGWIPPYDFHPVRVTVIGFWAGAPSGAYKHFLTILNPKGGGSPWDFRLIDRQANQFTFELFNTTSGGAVVYQQLGVGNSLFFSCRIGE